jgi:hypothetical protein
MRETGEFGATQVVPGTELVPEVGDDVYTPTWLYIDHGEDDIAGGLARVTRVYSAISAGQPCPFIAVAELPGRGFNWRILREQQEELRERFGDQRAYPDPDYG